MRPPPRRRTLAPALTVVVAGAVAAACAPAPRDDDSASSAPRVTASPSASPATRAPTATPTPVPDPRLRTGFASLQRRVPAQVWVAVAGAGAPVVLGREQAVPAWSTSKVPLAVAAREQAPAGEDGGLDSDIRLAITISDNGAAERLWSRLGSQTEASQQVEEVLRRHGDAVTQVPTTRRRAAYTTFGQTQWAVRHQVAFLRDLSCDPEGAEVIGLMRKVGGDQRVGFGADPKAAIKGGWGPDPQGRYLARQIAVVGSSRSSYAVAVVALPNNGRFDTALSALDEVAAWLTPRLGQVGPGYRCPLTSPGSPTP